MYFYNLLAYFAIYSILGWCGEVVFAAVCLGKFVNRGFLNGIACPIYGCGVVLASVCLEPIKNNLILMFIGSVIITTAIEFVGGFILEKFFGLKWWDYSDEPFNIKGYVCLKFSLLWGFAFLFVMKIIHPIMEKFVNIVPRGLGITLLWIFYICIIADYIITVTTLLKVKKQLKVLKLLENTLTDISDSIGSRLSDTTLKGVSEVKELSEKREELGKKLTAEYAKFKEKNKGKISHVFNRINKAYPKLDKVNPKLIMEKIEEFMKNKK